MIGANYVTSSSDAEERLKAPLIGALYADKGFLDVVARSMMRERMRLKRRSFHQMNS